jgi:two-component system sensor histidine kinase YesM
MLAPRMREAAYVDAEGERMKATNHTLQNRLIILFLVITIIPALIMTLVMPYYFNMWMMNTMEILTESIVKTLTENINIYLNDLERLTIMPYTNNDVMTSLKLEMKPDFGEFDNYTKYYAARSLYNNFSSYLQQTRTDIVNTILISLNGTVFISSRNNIGDEVKGYDFSRQEWYKKAIEAGGKAVFIGNHPQDYLTQPGLYGVFSVARIIKDPDSMRPLAFLMADADTAVLERIVNNVQFSVSNIVAILDENNKVIYSKMQRLKSKPSSSQRIDSITDIALGDYTVVTGQIEPSEWKVAVFLLNRDMRRESAGIFVTGLILAIAGIAIAFMLFFFFSNSIVAPFKKMADVMHKVQNGDFTVRYAISSDDEIAQVGQALNDMIIKINELIDREYRAALNQRNAEYIALQSQIRPHFLYNTLNGFIGLNRLGDRDALEKAIISLRIMLRYSLGQEMWSTIKEEFKIIRSYCDLQLIRFGDRMNVLIDQSEETSEFRIPRLLLQPLVENSVIHGVEPSACPVRVLVKSKMTMKDGREVLSITVEDDGVGFDIGKLSEEKSIGIRNLRERLLMFYKGACFSLTSQSGVGTLAAICIPKEDLQI